MLLNLKKQYLNLEREIMNNAENNSFNTVVSEELVDEIKRIKIELSENT